MKKVSPKLGLGFFDDKKMFAFYSNCGEIDRKPTVAVAGRMNGKEGQREAQGSAFP